ncbi:MAG: DUF6371 domain-containing protein [Ginsengibacter sp.]
MKVYRYILEPFNGMKSRHTCPGCNKRNEFSFYIDSKTGELLPDHFGKCNRLDKCGYHLNPYKNGYSEMIYEQEKGEYKDTWRLTKPQPKPQPQTKEISFIPSNLFKQSLKNYERNNFVKFLIQVFGNDIAAGLISKYFIGTSKQWPGANIFWQVDIKGKIRSGKIMLYSPTTGKRVKEPFDYVAWVHTAIKQPEFQLRQIFFGEHLLKNKKDPVAIVESEKTAISASVYFPQFIWIAAGSLNGLNLEKCHVLKDRQVILYPDLSSTKPGKSTAFEKWSAKANEFSNIAHFTVNDLLERKAGEHERKAAYDLADFLIKFDYKQFIEPEKIPVLSIEDIFLIPTEHHTGKEFDNLIMVYFKTKEGKNYDLLYGKDEYPLPFGMQKEIVKRLSQFFNKKFKPILFGDVKVYCNEF